MQKKIIIIDGFAGSGKGFYFNLLAKKIDCHPIPTHDGIIELLKNNKKLTVNEIKNHLNKHFIYDVVKNQLNDSYMEVPIPKLGSIKEKIDNFYFPPYQKIIDIKIVNYSKILDILFPKSQKPYLIMGQAGIDSKRFLKKFGYDVLLIHSARSAFSCISNLVSRTPLSQSPITQAWNKWGWFYFLARGYPASIIYINYRLSKDADLTINWPNVTDIKKIFKINLNKNEMPLDDTNQNPYWFTYLVLLTAPILIVKILLKRFN